jgi:hypothetical protein
MTPMADEPEREVLSSLPRTRPARRSARRAPAGLRAAPPPPPRRPVPPAGWATPGPAPDDGPGGPVGAVAGAVRAVGGVAGLGVAVAGHGVRALLGRLPRP